MHSRFIFIFHLLLFVFQLKGFQYSVNTKDSLEIEKAEINVIKGYELGIKNLNDSSLYYFNSSIKTFEKFEKWDLYLDANLKLAKAYIHNDKLKEANYIHQKTFEIAKSKLVSNNPKIVEILFALLKSYYFLGDIVNTKELIKIGSKYHSQIGNQKIFIDFYNFTSDVYLSDYQHIKSLNHLDKSYKISTSLGIKGREEAYYYLSKGEIYLTMDDFLKAKESLTKAKNIFEKLGYEYNAILCSYDLGNLEIKKKNFKKALKIYNEILDTTNKNKTLGDIYREYIYIYVYESIGNIHFENEDFDKAQHYFKLGIKSASNKKHSSINLKLGENYLRLNEYDSALQCFQNGLSSIINKNFKFEYNTNYENPSLEYINSIRKKGNIFLLLKGKAEAFYLKYLENNNVNELNKAIETNNLLLKTFDTIIKADNNIFGGGAHQNLVKSIIPIYSQSIKHSLAIAKINNNDHMFVKAFEIAEKSRSNSLIRGINSSNAKYYANIPDSLLVKERNLKTDFNYYQTKLQLSNRVKSDSTLQLELKEKIFNITSNREELEFHLESNYPKYFNLKYDNSLPKVTNIQKSLDSKTTLLEYFVSDESIYAFTITKNSYTVKELNYPSNLIEKIALLPKYLKKEDISSFSKLSFQLYNDLIKPLKINTPEIIIIPAGELWHLNFDLLIKKKPEILDYKLMDFMIKDHTISYSYSVKLLNLDLGIKNTSNKNEILAFSYNDNNENNSGNYIAMRGFRNATLGDLPGSRKEIYEISSVMNGSYYYGTFASEKNFKENAKDYNILHLALHGVIDDKNPINSKLYFTQNEGSQDNDNMEDNYLHAYELYNIELNAELAVLSACNTGSGKIVKGEGIMSLGRAFTYAGCKSLLISQWEVSDEFTPAIMKNFYQNLKDGKTKAGALRAAKLAHLENSNNLTSNPYFWAPLVQLGDNRPLQKEFPWIWILSGSIGLLFISFLIYKNRK